MANNEHDGEERWSVPAAHMRGFEDIDAAPERASAGTRKSSDRQGTRGGVTGRGVNGSRAGHGGSDARRGAAAGRKPPRPSKASPARLAALDVVHAVRERDAFAQDVIASRIDASTLSPEDRAFATLLALGTVSARGTLDEVIDRALNKPKDAGPALRDALQISTYEIVFLGKAPHAAVSQGVELVRSFAPQASRLANAALHRVVELSRSFPFGDPATDLDALARLHAFPAWLARMLVEQLGAEGAVAFMKASNEPAPVFLAVNSAKATEESVLAAFRAAGEEAAPVELGGARVPGCLRVPDGRSLLVPQVKQLLAMGKVIVADAASQLVAASVLPDRLPGSFLEVGAGRATKTVLLQSGALRAYGTQMDGYVTIDNHAFKTKLLLDRAKQCGVQVAEAVTGDATKLDDVLPGRLFDAVFIDAPCTGLGTLRRHPEIRWRLKPADIPSFARVQLGMLLSAAGHVAPGGTLCYATCTVTPQENAGVVKAFLASEAGKGFKLAPIAGRSHVATALAPGSSDAHFAVRFVREG